MLFSFEKFQSVCTLTLKTKRGASRKDDAPLGYPYNLFTLFCLPFVRLPMLRCGHRRHRTNRLWWHCAWSRRHCGPRCWACCASTGQSYARDYCASSRRRHCGCAIEASCAVWHPKCRARCCRLACYCQCPLWSSSGAGSHCPSLGIPSCCLGRCHGCIHDCHPGRCLGCSLGCCLGGSHGYCLSHGGCCQWRLPDGSCCLSGPGVQ